MCRQFRSRVCRVAWHDHASESRIDVDDCPYWILRIRLRSDPRSDGIMEAQDLNFLQPSQHHYGISGIHLAHIRTQTAHQFETDSSARGTISDSMPAFAKTTSAGRPNSLLTCWNKFATACSSLRSAWTARTFVLLLFKSWVERTVSSSLSLRRPATTTPSAPARTQTRAAAWLGC